MRSRGKKIVVFFLVTALLIPVVPTVGYEPVKDHVHEYETHYHEHVFGEALFSVFWPGISFLGGISVNAAHEVFASGSHVHTDECYEEGAYHVHEGDEVYGGECYTNCPGLLNVLDHEEEGYYDCDKCNGSGTVTGDVPCDICRGDGYYIDWVTCTACNGKKVVDGLVPCTRCEEKGVIPESKTCADCDGRGTVTAEKTCPVCKGNKEYETDCTDCDGNGKVGGYVECGTCKGQGKTAKSCTECAGDGEVSVKCTECNGDGKLDWKTCSTCKGNGTGPKTCDMCEGSGYHGYIDCGGCSGKGGWYEDCAICSGTGKVTKQLDCTECDGDGKVPQECGKCKGDGKLDWKACTVCSGNGVTAKQCTVCKGTGKNGTYNCGSCNGTGGEYADCSSCSGTGKITKKKNCTVCGGDGKVSGTCVKCSGNGYLGWNSCTACGGSGTKPKTCATCRGSGTYGTYNCGTCNGTGGEYEDCSTCSGNGTYRQRYSCSKTVSKKCSKCNGSGNGTWVKCSICNGTGSKTETVTSNQVCSKCNGLGSYDFTTTTSCGSCAGNGTKTTLKDIKCTTCKGTGKKGVRMCPTCGGLGTWQEDVTADCTTCSGTGSLTIKQKVPCSKTEKVTETKTVTCSKGAYDSCTTCSGTGKVSATCGTCSGKGYYYSSVTCGSCSGTGKSSLWNVCGTCNGKKTFPAKCSTCSGSGKDGTTTCSSCWGEGGAYAGCSVCSGTGSCDNIKTCTASGCVSGKVSYKETCSTCNGTRKSNNWLECGTCLGKKTFPATCKTCSGSGVNGTETCASCNGSKGSYPACVTCNSTGKIDNMATCTASGCVNGKVAGKVSCAKCSGSGKSTKWIGCGLCSGGGTLPKTCDKCKGTKVYGTLPCTVCKGNKGWYPVCGVCAGSGNVPNVCSLCSGTGYGTCTMCSGNKKVWGKINCTRCKGTKRYITACTTCDINGKVKVLVDCSTCGADGLVSGVCPECNGRRMVSESMSCTMCMRNGVSTGVVHGMVSCPKTQRGVVSCSASGCVNGRVYGKRTYYRCSGCKKGCSVLYGISCTGYVLNCNKSTDKRYTDGGRGELCIAICSSTVISFTPSQKSQSFTVGSGEIYTAGQFTYQDGLRGNGGSSYRTSDSFAYGYYCETATGSQTVALRPYKTYVFDEYNHLGGGKRRYRIGDLSISDLINLGWVISVDSVPVGISEDISETYEITLDYQGGLAKESRYLTYSVQKSGSYGTNLNIVPTKAQRAFLGFFTERYGKGVKRLSSEKPSGNEILYANYATPTPFNMTLRSNDGSLFDTQNRSNIVTFSGIRFINEKDAYETLGENAARCKVNISGINRTTDGRKVHHLSSDIAGVNVVFTGNIAEYSTTEQVLYAIMDTPTPTPTPYTIKMDFDSGYTRDLGVKEYDKTIVRLWNEAYGSILDVTIPYKDGRKALGWFTGRNGTGVEVIPSDKPINSCVIYAKYATPTPTSTPTPAFVPDTDSGHTCSADCYTGTIHEAHTDSCYSVEQRARGSRVLVCRRILGRYYDEEADGTYTECVNMCDKVVCSLAARQESYTTSPGDMASIRADITLLNGTKRTISCIYEVGKAVGQLDPDVKNIPQMVYIYPQDDYPYSMSARNKEKYRSQVLMTVATSYEAIDDDNLAEGIFTTTRKDAGEYSVFTGTANNTGSGTVTTNSGRPFEITFDGLITYINVVPDNTYTQIDAPGYGTRDYAYSVTDRNLLKDIPDSVSHRTYLGNTVMFDFDVYEDATGDGMSSDDYYYRAGTEIPVGLGRTFYLTSLTSTGEHTIVFGTVCINSTSDRVFVYDAALNKIVLADSSDTGNLINKDNQTMAYSAAYYYVRSGLADACISYSPGAQEGTSFPCKVLPLKPGYPITILANTYGEFFTTGAYVKAVPHFAWVSEDMQTRRTDISLFYDTFIDGSRHNLIKAGSESDRNNIKWITASDPVLGIPNADYALKGSLMAYDVNERLCSYTYSMARAEECFYKEVNYSSLPSGVRGASTFTGNLERSAQKWYMGYAIPSDIMVLFNDSSLGKASDEERLAAYLCGSRGFIEDGYIEVTFDITAVDDAGRCTTLSARENGIIVYYRLGERAGDDYSVGNIR